MRVVDSPPKESGESERRRLASSEKGKNQAVRRKSDRLHADSGDRRLPENPDERLSRLPLGAIRYIISSVPLSDWLKTDGPSWMASRNTWRKGHWMSSVKIPVMTVC